MEIAVLSQMRSPFVTRYIGAHAGASLDGHLLFCRRSQEIGAITGC